MVGITNGTINGKAIDIKKKKRRKNKKGRKQVKFKIIISRNNKQTKFVGVFSNLHAAYAKYLKKIKENEKIIFPVRFINSKQIKPIHDEILLLKIRDKEEENYTMLRNEIGKLVKVSTSNKYEGKKTKYNNKIIHWNVFERHEWKTEELFWVYGYHPRNDRKNFNFIYENLVKKPLIDKSIIARIVVYQNKFICDYGYDMGIVFCKNVSDALRLYTMIEETALNEKIENIIWNQRVVNRKLSTYWLDRLQEKTNFSRLKLKRNSLRP